MSAASLLLSYFYLIYIPTARQPSTNTTRDRQSVPSVCHPITGEHVSISLLPSITARNPLIMSSSPPSYELPPETQFRPAGPDEDSQEYSVETLLAEDPIGRQYLVAWEDIDPSTGRRYRPSWEPKEACTNELIRLWKIDLAKGKVKVGKTYGAKVLREWDRDNKNKPRASRVKQETREGKKAERKQRKAEAKGTSAAAAAAKSTAGGSRERSKASTVEPEQDEEEEEEDGMEILMSDAEVGKGEGKGKAPARQMSAVSETDTSSPVAGGKRKRGGKENDDAPAVKKTRGRPRESPYSVCFGHG